MRKKLGLAFLLSLGIVATTSLGFSSWIIPALTFVASPSGDDSVRAVAYVESTGNRYASIERAVEAANSLGGTQTVYVIPEVSSIVSGGSGSYVIDPIVVRESISISSGVSLVLPYGLSDGSPQVISDSVSGGSLADSTAARVATNLKTEVLLDDGVTLTISPGATLTVGGSIGESGNLIGAELGPYAQISMLAGSSIVCYGNLNVYGYIKPLLPASGDAISEDAYPKLTIMPSGGSVPNVLVPLVVYDFSSGTTILNRYNSQLFPFNIYDIPNISVPFDIHYGSVFRGTTYFNLGIQQLNINVGFNPIIDLVGTDNSSAIIRLSSSGSHVIVENEPASSFDVVFNDQAYKSNLTIDDHTAPKSKSYYSVFGDCQINNLSFELTVEQGVGSVGAWLINQAISTMLGGTNTLTTSGMFLPFSYKWDISIHGNVTFPSDIQTKFLPGSRFNVNPGATWNLNGVAAFYGSSTAITSYPSASLPDAYVLNNGTVNVNNALGGRIETTYDGSQINFSSARSFSVTSNEESGDVQLSPVIRIEDDSGAQVDYTVLASDANKLFYGLADSEREFGHFDVLDVYSIRITSQPFLDDSSRIADFGIVAVTGGEETAYEPDESGASTLYLPQGSDTVLRISNPSNEVAYVENSGTGAIYPLLGNEYVEISISSSVDLSIVPRSIISPQIKVSMNESWALWGSSSATSFDIALSSYYHEKNSSFTVTWQPDRNWYSYYIDKSSTYETADISWLAVGDFISFENLTNATLRTVDSNVLSIEGKYMLTASCTGTLSFTFTR